MAKPTFEEWVKANAASPEQYQATADALVERIVALGPQVLTISGTFELLDLKILKYEDLQPSLAQISQALKQARYRLSTAGITDVPRPPTKATPNGS